METSWDRWRSRALRFTAGGLDLAGYDLTGGAGGPTAGSPGGEAPVATFLHGYPSSSLDSAALLARLDGWRVVTVDFPGFGASAKPTGHRYSIHACADVVEAWWAERDVASTVLVAHDYGATVGQELVARHLDGTLAVGLDGVVWMNGGVYPDLHRPTAGQQMLLDPDHGSELAAAVTEELFRSGIEGTWGTRRSLTDAEAHEMWASMDDGGGVARMHDLLHYVADRRAHEARWVRALESSGLPAAFVWGDVDPVSGAHMIERVQARVAGATVVRMADVGHWPPLEAPDEVAAAVRSLQ